MSIDILTNRLDGMRQDIDDKFKKLTDVVVEIATQNVRLSHVMEQQAQISEDLVELTKRQNALENEISVAKYRGGIFDKVAGAIVIAALLFFINGRFETTEAPRAQVPPSVTTPVR